MTCKTFGVFMKTEGSALSQDQIAANLQLIQQREADGIGHLCDCRHHHGAVTYDPVILDNLSDKPDKN